MQITLYNFSKKVNSTLQPSGGTTFEGYLRNDDPVSVMSPSIQFTFADCPSFNYAWIPEFSRFYWINDWQHLEGHWIASLTVDVLATYRSQISSKSLYAVRASAESNPYIIDSKYPATTHMLSSEVQSERVQISSINGSYSTTPETFFSIGFEYGTFVLGLFAPEGNGITYYALNARRFKGFAEALADHNPLDDEPEWWEGIIPGVAKSISNPMQYIASVNWFPFSFTQLFGSDGDINQITLGFWKIDLIGVKIDPQQSMVSVSMPFNLPSHPKAASRGLYLNSEPFTHHVLNYYPFGVFPIDAQAVMGYSEIQTRFITDWITGKAKLEIYTISGSTRRIIAVVEGSVSVQITIGQSTVDFLGVAQSIISGVSSLAGVMTPPVAKRVPTATGSRLDVTKKGSFSGSAAADALGGFVSAAKQAAPTLQTTGGIGSLLAFNSNLGDIPVLLSYFSDIVDEKNDELGRPLCRVRTPSQIPGFIQAEGAYLVTSGTAEESDAVSAYLNGGFFYE